MYAYLSAVEQVSDHMAFYCSTGVYAVAHVQTTVSTAAVGNPAKPMGFRLRNTHDVPVVRALL